MKIAPIHEAADECVSADGPFASDWDNEEHLQYLDAQLERTATELEWRAFCARRAIEARRSARELHNDDPERWALANVFHDIDNRDDAMPERAAHAA